MSSGLVGCAVERKQAGVAFPRLSLTCFDTCLSISLCAGVVDLVTCCDKSSLNKGLLDSGGGAPPAAPPAAETRILRILARFALMWWTLRSFIQLCLFMEEQKIWAYIDTFFLKKNREKKLKYITESHRRHATRAYSTSAHARAARQRAAVGDAHHARLPGGGPDARAQLAAGCASFLVRGRNRLLPPAVFYEWFEGERLDLGHLVIVRCACDGPISVPRLSQVGFQGRPELLTVPELQPRIVQRDGVRDVGEGHETLDRDRVEDADFVAAQEPLEVLVGAVVPRMHEHDAPRFDKGCAEGSEVEEPRTGDRAAAGDDDRVHGVAIGIGSSVLNRACGTNCAKKNI